MRFSCKSHVKELEGNETVSVERELVPWPAFSAADDSGKIAFVDAKCGVDGKFSPSVEDYTCTRDCQAPQIDRSIMVGGHTLILDVNFDEDVLILAQTYIFHVL